MSSCRPWRRVVHQLVIFVVPVRSRPLIPVAPSSNTDHFVEFRPPCKSVVSGVNDDETSATSHVSAEGRPDVFSPKRRSTGETGTVIHYDHDIVAPGWIKR